MIEVTTLNDSGPGSLRAALSAPGPCYVVFRVRGLIELAAPISITEPYLTLAGDSVPGGISLINRAPGSRAIFQVKTHDVLIRGIGFLSGPRAVEPDPQSRVFNLVLDRCTFNELAAAVPPRSPRPPARPPRPAKPSEALKLDIANFSLLPRGADTVSDLTRVYSMRIVEMIKVLPEFQADFIH